MFGCKSEEIILHGEISGIVTNASTNYPIQGAVILLKEAGDTASSMTNGTYLFKNLIPGAYEINTSKSSFTPLTRIGKVVSAETQIIDFPLIPLPEISVNYLDFGLDMTSLKFTISNPGNLKVTYVLINSKDWITVNPASGDVTIEGDTLTVTINRTGLSDSLYKEQIEVVTTNEHFLRKDTIKVYLNGVVDMEGNVYKIVKIGTQTWMAENLNIGMQVSPSYSHLDNGVIEKYCYADNKINCDIYGGLYEWRETMQYSPLDTGIIGTTQGICPVGWHVPTDSEWIMLINYLGGDFFAGGKLKESGTIHWISPNVATNESGFTALPGGLTSKDNLTDCRCDLLGNAGIWWSSLFGDILLRNSSTFADMEKGGNPPSPFEIENGGFSVRCIKDPPGK
jgi:uncharacterized protein (TIGR02145 family)